MLQTRILIAAAPTLFRQGLATLIAACLSLEVCGEAADADEARRVAAREEVDLILLDSQLPCEPGCDLIACLRAARPQAPIVMLGEADRDTHSEEEADDALRTERAEALVHGAIAYLPVRADSRELIRLLTTIGASRRCGENENTGAAAVSVTPARRPRITERERAVISMIAQGLCNKEAAHRLGISTQTVKNHVSRLLEKLALADRTQLAVFAVEHNFEF